MKDIHIQFLPLDQLRFGHNGEIGDYFETPTSIEFRIAILPDPIHSYACLLHELVEKIRNDQLGIADADVDQWDTDHADHPDPGLLPDAPYHKTHMEADAIERTFLALAGGDWAEYEEAIDKLCP